MNPVFLLGMPSGSEWLVLVVFAMLFFAVPLIALVDILRSDFRGANDKVIWVIVVLFIPLLGSLLYFLIGRNQRAVS